MSDSIRPSAEGHEGATASPTAADSIDIDLYCLRCGYNLRGLAGDPVRCPECGHRNPVGLIEIPAAQIRKQLDRMESAPTLSVAALLVVTFFATALMWDRVAGTSPPLFGYCLGLSLCISLAALIATVVRFRHSCRRRPGWFAVLVRFHLVTLLLIAVIVLVFTVGGLLAGRITPSWNGYGYISGARVGLMFGVFGIVGLIIWLFVSPIRRWLKTPMEQLQRDVAVEMARQRLRRELSRKPGRRGRQ